MIFRSLALFLDVDSPVRVAIANAKACLLEKRHYTIERGSSTGAQHVERYFLTSLTSLYIVSSYVNVNKVRQRRRGGDVSTTIQLVMYTD